MRATRSVLPIDGRLSSRCLLSSLSGRRDMPGSVDATFFPMSGSELERAEGFEPSTPTLARLCSTPELRPHPTDPYHTRGGGLQEVARPRSPPMSTGSPDRVAGVVFGTAGKFVRNGLVQRYLIRPYWVLSSSRVDSLSKG